MALASGFLIDAFVVILNKRNEDSCSCFAELWERLQLLKSHNYGVMAPNQQTIDAKNAERLRASVRFLSNHTKLMKDAESARARGDQNITSNRVLCQVSIEVSRQSIL